MNKFMTGVVAILAVLLAIQTVRLHRAEQGSAAVSPKSQGPGTPAGREDLAEARFLLEDPDHSGNGGVPSNPMSDYLVEAMAAFLESDEIYSSGAESLRDRGTGSAEGKSGDKAAGTAGKSAEAETGGACRAHDGAARTAVDGGAKASGIGYTASS
ncbi:MAG TPA: hypothetical protein PLM14_01465 [Candidatus Hydrogenedentes bacterium]|nr:hypothetical protein [Candidatus Hydrogenedentota bacterium]HQE81633.1 hypothetical protein [Candidatus Hydrogenedentota bacterium]HQH52124.1 hypothetical protein [Candidatus Hydrogenedentota bacterium]HQM50210.1 hypothetical protein [Candidatus Hydrogenedentota bacterium]